MRLIDADWVLGHLKPYEPSDEEWIVTGGTALRLIHNAVDNAPTVDAVIVTRCENCKYRIYKHVNDWIGEIGGCSIFNHPMPNDAFCSFGERKENNHEKV